MQSVTEVPASKPQAKNSLDNLGQLFGGFRTVLIAMTTLIGGQVTPPVKWILPPRLGDSKSKRRTIHSHADGATDTARSPSRSYCVAILAIDRLSQNTVMSEIQKTLS